MGIIGPGFFLGDLVFQHLVDLGQLRLIGPGFLIVCLLLVRPNLLVKQSFEAGMLTNALPGLIVPHGFDLAELLELVHLVLLLLLGEYVLKANLGRYRLHLVSLVQAGLNVIRHGRVLVIIQVWVLVVVLYQEWELLNSALQTHALLEPLQQDHLVVKLLEDSKQTVAEDAFKLPFRLPNHLLV